VAFVVATVTHLDRAEAVFSSLQAGVSTAFGWLLILVVQAILVFVVYLGVSRFGHIRLGGPDAEPEWSGPAWFAMLFSAGMGIGLMFWSVAEPVTHFQDAPGSGPAEAEAVVRAMDLTFLHWGLHAWAIYALVGLSLAWVSFNRGLPLTVRSAFHPLLGDRIHGPLGRAVDILAVVATLFGVATSLGLGVAQINAGLRHVAGVPVSDGVQLGLVGGITAVATLSVVSGLDRGIKRLSQLNLLVALALLGFLLVLGPTLFILEGVVQYTGHYLQNLITLGTWTATLARDSTWQGDWTVFYWSWWIAWSPFVGMFIARISRGRTVREFVAGVLLVPSLLTFLWVTTFGGTALHQALYRDSGIVAAVEADVATALFELLGAFPLAGLTSVLAMLLVFVFFVTSSDSGSLVIDIIASGGDLDPPVAQRVFWAVSEGVVAAVLLVAGGLTALRTAAILTGLPFALILGLMGWSLLRGLRREMPVPSPGEPRDDGHGAGSPAGG
jgi:choline/glycine/proline betaine transport protein